MRYIGIFLAGVLSVSFLSGLLPVSQAALPGVADGQPLPSLAPMLKQTTPGVVNIATRGTVKVRSNPLMEDPFFRHFFNLPNQPQERPTQSLGSGVIVDAKKGYILTNHHVIATADEIAVTLSDGRLLDAKLIGSDPHSDVAVIQVEADDLTELTWGDSDRLQVGDFVVAIGNPFGLGQTVTSGIVSALGRSGLGIEAYEDFIQTDAPINPGNSGGALVDLNGHLIGINTAILGPSGGNIGIGFAIPAQMAKQIMEQLIEFGEVRRGQLGVVVQDLNPDLAKAFDIKQQKGAVISQVKEDSAAGKAGLKAGDIVIEVDGRAIDNAADMRNAIGLQRVGKVVSMKIIRDGKTKTLQATVDQPEVTALKGEILHEKLTGAQLGLIDSKDGKQRGLQLLEVDPYSSAAAVGLQKGDIITSINRQPITTLEAAKNAAKGERVLLNIQRGDSALFLVLR